MKHLTTPYLLFFILFFISFDGYGQDNVRFEPDTTVITKTVSIRPREHLLGIRYSYAMTGVHFTPDLKQKGVNTPLNFAILYTYYHPLWEVWSYFGIQTGVKYGQQGFTTGYNLDDMDQTISTIEIPFVTQLKFDIKNILRIMVHVGPFAGYRLTTTKASGFDCFDRRIDYGVLGGGGIAIRVHPIEFHIEASYQYSLSWLYHPEKFSSSWWLYSYPHQLSFSFGIHYNFN